MVLYNGLFKTNQPPASINPAMLSMAGKNGATTTGASLFNTMNLANGGTAPGVAAKNIDQILPNGESFDLDAVKRFNVRYDTLVLPKLDPKQEVGIDESLLIVPVPAKNNPSGGQSGATGLLQSR